MVMFYDVIVYVEYYERELSDWNEGIKKSMIMNESLEWEVIFEFWEWGFVKCFEYYVFWCCIMKICDKNLLEVVMLKINFLFCFDILIWWRKMVVNFDCIIFKVLNMSLKMWKELLIILN